MEPFEPFQFELDSLNGYKTVPVEKRTKFQENRCTEKMVYKKYKSMHLFFATL